MHDTPPFACGERSLKMLGETVKLHGDPEVDPKNWIARSGGIC
jgi:hypothetical protein